jgi:hypothetical protein
MRAIQNKEDWCVWASHTAMGVGTRTDLIRGLKQRLDSIRLTADGVVPLDLGCLSSREGPVRPSRRCLHAQWHRGGNRWLAQEERGHGSSVRGQDNRLPSHNYYSNSVIQLLLQVTELINTRAESRCTTCFTKVHVHRGEAPAAAAAEPDPMCPLATDQDPEAVPVYVLYRKAWLEWDAQVREELVQRAAKRRVSCILWPRTVTGVETSPPTLPLTAAWMLLQN